MQKLRLATGALVSLAACAGTLAAQSAQADDAQTVQALKDQMRAMQQQMEQMQRQIENLSNKPAPPPPMVAAAGPTKPAEVSEPKFEEFLKGFYGTLDVSFDDATKAAAHRAKLTDYEVEFMEPELSWAQSLVLQMKTKAIKAMVSSSVGKTLNPLGEVAQRFDPLTREVERISRLSEPNRAYAYCFCAAE